MLSTLSDSELVSIFSLQKVTKGARHKIVISIQKLKERQNLLRSLEKVSGPQSTYKRMWPLHVSDYIFWDT